MFYRKNILQNLTWTPNLMKNQINLTKIPFYYFHISNKMMFS